MQRITPLGTSWTDYAHSKGEDPTTQNSSLLNNRVASRVKAGNKEGNIEKLSVVVTSTWDNDLQPQDYAQEA